MHNTSDLVLVGRFGAPHGIRGWVKVYSFTEDPADIFNYANWNVSIGNKKNLVAEVTEYRAHQAAFVVKLATIEDRDEVAKLTNGEIYIPREQLPTLDDDQYYWHDLIGMKVINQESQVLGEVLDFMNTGANDIMVVQTLENKKILIPYVPEMYIQHLNTTERIMTVYWEE